MSCLVCAGIVLGAIDVVSCNMMDKGPYFLSSLQFSKHSFYFSGEEILYS